MSQENVELVWSVVEDGALARASGEFDSKAAIARQAGLWDPGVEWMPPEPPCRISRVWIGRTYLSLERGGGAHLRHAYDARIGDLGSALGTPEAV
jgi:hypothetical protein